MFRTMMIAAMAALVAAPALAASAGRQPRPAPAPADSRAATEERERATKAQEQRQDRWNAAAARSIRSICRGCTGPSGRTTPMFLGDRDPPMDPDPPDVEEEQVE